MSTLDPAELAKFDQSSSRWWDDSQGEFAMLHRLNPLRLDYIISILQKYHDNLARQAINNAQGRPDLSGFRVLDVGCGGGILALPLARLGAQVIGVDASHNALKQARQEADRQGVQLVFHCGTLENLVLNNSDDFPPASFDFITLMELIEHVSDPELLLKSCMKLLKPGGFLFLSTINRTLKAYFKAIVAAEYLLRWLPRGTHEWSKFLHPAEIAEILEDDADLLDIKGINYQIMRSKWHIDSEDYSCNFIAAFRKKISESSNGEPKI